jgi:hypothetical protein
MVGFDYCPPADLQPNPNETRENPMINLQIKQEREAEEKTHEQAGKSKKAVQSKKGERHEQKKRKQEGR